jgi:spore coat protein U-like protein
MKTKLLAAAFIATGLSLNAAAADTATLTVQATVSGICKFQTNTATLTLANSAGNIDPSSATSATGSTTLAYKCTKGQSPVFANNNGLNYTGSSLAVKHASLPDVMAYTLSLTNTGAGNGFGPAAQTLTMSGTITQANFQNAAAGSYSDTVTITLTP